jgi:uncharacterized coiled-coil protein SlyX
MNNKEKDIWAMFKNNKEKDIWAMFNELNSMLYEVMGDFNKAWAENIELKKEVAWFKKYTDALVEHKDMVCLPADLKNLRESNAALATENQELKKQVDTLNEVITQAWFTDVEEKDKQIEYLLKRVKELSDPELKDDEDVTKTFMDAQANPKDIKFDGVKLVTSVEEAASKLKSIKEHNNLFTKEISFSTGIACPKCGSELMYVDQNLLLSNPPQRRVQCSKCNHIDYILV